MIAINGGFRGIFPKPAPEDRAGFGTIPIGNKPNGHDWRFPLDFSQTVRVVAGFGDIAVQESVMAMIGGFHWNFPNRLLGLARSRSKKSVMAMIGGFPNDAFAPVHREVDH